MGINEAHLVSISLGNASDEVLDMAEGGADGGHGLAGSKPGINLELAATIDELEVEVEVLEIACQLASGAFNNYHLGLHQYLHPLRDVHRLRREYRLHLSLSRMKIEVGEEEEEEEKPSPPPWLLCISSFR